MLSKVEASFTFTFDGKRRIEPFDRTWTLSIANVGIIWNSANILFQYKTNCQLQFYANRIILYIYVYGLCLSLIKAGLSRTNSNMSFFHTY